MVTAEHVREDVALTACFQAYHALPRQSWCALCTGWELFTMTANGFTTAVCPRAAEPGHGRPLGDWWRSSAGKNPW